MVLGLGVTVSAGTAVTQMLAQAKILEPGHFYEGAFWAAARHLLSC